MTKVTNIDNTPYLTPSESLAEDLYGVMTIESLILAPLVDGPTEALDVLKHIEQFDWRKDNAPDS